MYSSLAIQDGDEFDSLSEQIWRNLAIHHMNITWMGASQIEILNSL